MVGFVFCLRMSAKVDRKSSAHLPAKFLSSGHVHNWPGGLMCLDPLSFCCAERSAGFKDSNAWPGAKGGLGQVLCSTLPASPNGGQRSHPIENTGPRAAAWLVF